MNSIIEEEIMMNHNQADAFISLFFAGLDAVTYIVILTLFGCELKGCSSPKQKLSLFLILDGILRIINMYIDAYSKTFVQETVFSLIVTLQFYLTMSILEQIFLDKCNETILESELQIRNKTLFSFLFFCLVFSFKGLMTSYGLISCLQYICILVSITIFYKYIGNKIDLFLSNITKKNNQFHGQNFINNLPFFILSSSSLCFLSSSSFSFLACFSPGTASLSSCVISSLLTNFISNPSNCINTSIFGFAPLSSKYGLPSIFILFNEGNFNFANSVFFFIFLK